MVCRTQAGGKDPEPKPPTNPEPRKEPSEKPPVREPGTPPKEKKARPAQRWRAIG
jgi:hypothetical protein